MPKKNKKHAKNRRKSRAGKIMLSFLLTALIVFGVLSVTVLFPISDIKVKGKSIYSAQQILDISGIDVGDNLFLLDSKAKSNIVTKLPYISSVKFKRELPDKLTIVVLPAVPERCYYNGNTYVVTDNNNKVLEKVSSVSNDLLTIKADFDNNIKIADTVSLTKEEQSNILAKILSEPALKDFKINSVDVKDSIDITVIIENRFNVRLGDYTDIEGKLAHLAAMIEKMDESATGDINLKSWSQDKPEGYFTAKSLNFAEEESPTEE